MTKSFKYVLFIDLLSNRPSEKVHEEVCYLASINTYADKSFDPKVNEHWTLVKNHQEWTRFLDSIPTSNKRKCDDWLVAEKLHQLAEKLPHTGYKMQVIWVPHKKHKLPLNCNTLTFGALKRLQCWHNAEIICILSKNDSASSIQCWVDYLDIEISTDMNDILKRKTIWHGQISLTDKKNLTNCVLPGFSLVDQRQTEDVCEEVKTFNIPDDGQVMHTSQQITVVQVINNSDIPLLYITPEFYKLSVMGNSCWVDVSRCFLEIITENSIGIIARLECQKIARSMLTSSNALSTAKWKQKISANSLDFKAPDIDLKGSWFGIYFLLCNDNVNGCNAFVLPSPSHLRGQVMVDLAIVSNLVNYDQNDSNLSPSCWLERQALHSKESYIRKMKRFKSSDRSLAGISAPPVDSTIKLDAKEFIKHFRSDGLAAAEELSPIAFVNSSGNLILRSGMQGFEDATNASFNEAIKHNYYGINYCLDSRNAVYYDDKYQKLECRIIRNETVSTCTIEQAASPGTMTINSTRKSSIKHLQRTPRSKNKHQQKIQSQESSNRKPSWKAETNSKKWSYSRISKTTKGQTKKQGTDESEKATEKAFQIKTQSRSERHQKKLKYIVDQTLKSKGIGRNDICYPGCSQRLFTVTKSFVQDLKSSRGLHQHMRNIAESNVDQVVSFEKARLKMTT